MSKISNFEFQCSKVFIVGDYKERRLFASVKETKGVFIKKTVQRMICRDDGYESRWFFVDTGDFCPPEVNKMERAYKAKNNMENKTTNKEEKNNQQEIYAIAN